MSSRIRLGLCAWPCCLVCWCLTMNTESFAQVDVVDPHFPGVVRLRNEELEEITTAAVALSVDKSRVAEHSEILAWCVKASLLTSPPMLFEDVLVLVQWKERNKWSLLHLTRAPADRNPHSDGWRHGSGVHAGLDWSADFTAKPTEAEILRFVRGTNFGNNELSDTIRVLRVFVYRADWKRLLQEIKDGIDRREKQLRRARQLGL